MAFLQVEAADRYDRPDRGGRHGFRGVISGRPFDSRRANRGRTLPEVNVNFTAR